MFVKCPNPISKLFSAEEQVTLLQGSPTRWCPDGGLQHRGVTVVSGPSFHL